MSLTKEKQIDFVQSGKLAPVHRTYDQLVHNVAETSFTEITRAAGKVTDIITWTDNGKTVKIREEIYTYSGNNIDTATTKHYDGAGVLIIGETLTETYTFSGGNEFPDGN